MAGEGRGQLSEEGGGASRTTDPAAGSSAATDVSLREYFNEKIHADRKLNNERFVFAGALGAVIWFFIERHLGDLNHENARVAKVSESSVSSDTYLANEKQRDADRDKLDEWRAQKDREATQAVTRDEFNRTAEDTHRGDRSAKRDDYRIWIALAGLLIAAAVWWTGNHPDTQPVVVTPTVTAPSK